MSLVCWIGVLIICILVVRRVCVLVIRRVGVLVVGRVRILFVAGVGVLFVAGGDFNICGASLLLDPLLFLGGERFLVKEEWNECVGRLA